MAAMIAAKLDLGGDQPIIINRVSMDQPWQWLRAGWNDLRRCPATSIGYGLIWVVLSALLVGGLWAAGQGSWLLPLFAGFMFMGPLVAVGSYEMSRRLERDESPTLTEALTAWRANATQIALMGVLLMIFLLAWIRLATLLFALFFGTSIPTVEAGQVYSELLLSGPGLGMTVVGTVIGAILAFTA
ncbi:MAG: DUF2189 domain-containing protein, partial [Ectothiorhodospiraceae bacterium]|nr:DUF2189 domain-containing protein [Ectothiorhodospiraceae bacterium]